MTEVIEVPVGISQIGVEIPEHFFPAKKIAELRKIDPGYATKKGLGVLEARIPYDVSLEELVVQALEQIDYSDVRRIFLATESDSDMSKPMAVKALGKLGITIVPVQSKFACLAGLQALISACEYVVAHNGKPAIVIAVDRSIYSENEPTAEITQGCAAIAMRIELNPKLLALDYLYYGQYAEDMDDFKIPSRTAPFPEIDGPLTKPAFLNCLKGALKDWKAQNLQFGSIIDGLDCFIVHTPFIKMVVWYMAMFWRHEKYGPEEHLTIEDCVKNPDLWNKYKEIINETRRNPEFQDFLEKKVEPGLRYSPEIGNPYTVSILICLIAALEQMKKNEQIGMCGYGSGAGAIFLRGQAMTTGFKSNLREQINQKRKELTPDQYKDWRQRTLKQIRPQN